MILLDKEQARTIGLTNRRNLSSKLRAIEEEAVFELAKKELQSINSIGCYVSIKDELDTRKIINWCLEQNKLIALPKITSNTLSFYRITSMSQLISSSFGLLEPDSCKEVSIPELEIMLVPLSAFDGNGHRTGFGKGYYDSILNNSKRNVGLAFCQQEVTQIKTDPWDIPLTEVWTSHGKRVFTAV